MKILTGRVLSFAADPFESPPEESLRIDEAVALDGGRITALGTRAALTAAHPGAEIEAWGERLILPAFVDAHAHYPQIGIIASWGARLIDWLNGYTFPEEARFGDPAHARAAAEAHLDECLRHGIGTACVFCTSHPQSVDAYFEAAEARGMRMIAGKVMMDRNARPDLLDTPRRAHDETEALIARWAGRGRLGYAITPRFAPTSTPEQLEVAGALWAAHPDCLMQTHLSEQTEEIAWVRELFPEARDYLDVYQRFGLAGPGAVFGHAIHLEEREIAALAETGSAIAHCPTSNFFIGSGAARVRALRAAGVGVGLATDVGGGSSYSMLSTMRAAYEASQLAGAPLHPAQLLWLATEGAARALRLDGRVGRIAPGAEADLTALDLASSPLIAARAARAQSLSEELFATIMLGDDRAIAGVWIGGARNGGASLRPVM